ncbi:MAG: hypothetical protein ACE15E_22710, partial [Acidobacteriota bacterium]
CRKVTNSARFSHAPLPKGHLQLSATDQEVQQREVEQRELQTELRSLRSQPLLSKEAHRVEATLREQKTRTEDLAAKRSLLLSRRTEASRRLQTVTSEAAERRELIERESEIKAGFEGQILRMMREASASEIYLRISYQQSTTADAEVSDSR